MLSLVHKEHSFPQDVHCQATLEVEIDDQIIGPSTSTGKIKDLSEVHFNPDARYLSKTHYSFIPDFLRQLNLVNESIFFFLSLSLSFFLSLFWFLPIFWNTMTDWRIKEKKKTIIIKINYRLREMRFLAIVRLGKKAKHTLVINSGAPARAAEHHG